MLKEGGQSPTNHQKPCKSAISQSHKHNDSNRESKISVYSENMQYETRTEDGGRKTLDKASAVLTDTKINLFSSTMNPSSSHRSKTMKHDVA